MLEVVTEYMFGGRFRHSTCLAGDFVTTCLAGDFVTIHVRREMSSQCMFGGRFRHSTCLAGGFCTVHIWREISAQTVPLFIEL
jgi:hypothetical protein